MTARALLKNKWLLRLGWVVGGVLLLWALAWLLVPPIAKAWAEKSATERLGRKVTIGAIDFKPWSLELAVSDIAVASADGTAPQLQFKRVYIDAELESLLRLAPVVDAIEVQGPALRLAHLGEGRYDIDDVLARLAKPAGAPPEEPAKFALYNLTVTGGSLDFTDRTVGRTHALRELGLAIPFLSNLDSYRTVRVEPRLAFVLNGSRFDTAVGGTPFAQTRKGDATIRFAGFDLRPFLGYVPAGLPVKLEAATLDAGIRVAFEQTPKVSVRLSGTLRASGVAMRDAAGGELLAFDALALDLADVRPLERSAQFRAIALDAPVLSVRRDGQGRFAVLAAPEAAVATKTGASNPAGTRSAAVSSSEDTGWKVAVEQLSVRAGRVGWIDGALPPLSLNDFSFDATAMAYPFAQPAAFQGSARVGSSPSAASLTFSGLATDKAGSATLAIAGLPLALAAPYLAQAIEPQLAGRLSGEAEAAWQLPTETGKAVELRANVRRLVLDELRLQQGKTALAGARRIEITDAQMEWPRQLLCVSKVAVAAPRAAVARDAQGRWMFESWRKAPAAAATGAKAATAASEAVLPAWSVQMADVAISGGEFTYRDDAMGRPVAVNLTAVDVRLKDFEPLVAPAKARASPLTVSARVGAGSLEPGTLDFRGTAHLGPQPAAQGDVQMARLPLHAFEPYFGDALNIELLRADTSFKGRIRYAGGSAGPTVQAAGDAALEDLRANSVQLRQPAGPATAAAPTALATNEELLSWKALGLRGVVLSMAPGSATTVDVAETVLTDFYARVIVHPSGRVNLQDIVKSSVPAGASSTMAATATVATSASTSSTGPPPVIRFGPVALRSGKVLFSDRFVQPNYTANLDSLNGTLSAFSSVSPQGSPQMADLELRGRAEGTAPLEITGKLNPLAKPLALDIKATMRDLELPPLSPYSVKYAGHAIQRGKLSMDVAYKVLPDGQLTASNRLVLNQLTFGDAIKDAPNSLPVRLAVALLADRNGVIDIDLPISGSLNDPQFSLGPVIFKVIVNLIVKAITAPFSLLASAFGGGGDELSSIAFQPGTARLTPEATQNLDKVAKALADRPALKMTVAGSASAQEEREAYRKARLREMLEGEKRRAQVVSGGTATAVVTVSDAEYPALLKEVYRRADIPKPRNLVYLPKDLPPAEMEALLVEHIAVTEEAMRELAQRRGLAVKEYLIGKQLAAERLFLGAPKAGGDSKAGARAELTLAM